MSNLYQISADLKATTQDLARVERPSAALTLTRSATLSITTAGTIITWQTETRNQGFTWSGTTITIPTSGYYLTQFFFATGSVTLTTQRVVNGVNLLLFATTGPNVYHAGNMTRYYTAGDQLEIRVLPSVNTNINVNAENVALESPLLHIVQLSGVI